MLNNLNMSNATYDDTSCSSSLQSGRVTPLINYYSGDKDVNIETTQSHGQPQDQPTSDNSINCRLCNNSNPNVQNNSYIILSCNHLHHIYCLVDCHYNDNYRFDVINNEYFSTRKCPTCNTTLQTEELMFLHSKFLSYTKDKVESHQTKISNLETQFNKLKEELRVCYEYKQKLDTEREKSKQIVTSLMTLM